MRGRVAGQEALMHADATDEAHEVMHLGAFKARAYRRLVLCHIDIGDDHVARAIDKVTVEVGFMPLVLLDDFEVAGFGRVLFVSRGERADTGKLATFIKIGLLITEVDGHAGGAAHAVTIPVGVLIGIVERGMRDAGRREGFKILRLPTSPSARGGAGGEQEQGGRKKQSASQRDHLLGHGVSGMFQKRRKVVQPPRMSTISCIDNAS